jgi:hypothetical protein
MRSIVLLFVLWASAHADSLILRNGTRVTGRWWATDAKVINFLVNGRLQQYSRSEVVEVVFGVEPIADPVPAGAAPVPAPAPASTGSAPSAESLIREPAQIGAVYFQDGSDNLAPLERSEAGGHRASTASGARSGQYWEMPGARSPFRLRSDAQLVFVVEMPGGIAPGTFKLYPLQTRGNARRTKDGNGTALTISLTMRKVAGNIYVMSPVGSMAPGEYAFSPSNSNDAYCFGIDPAVPQAR